MGSSDQSFSTVLLRCVDPDYMDVYDGYIHVKRHVPGTQVGWYRVIGIYGPKIHTQYMGRARSLTGSPKRGVSGNLPRCY